MPVPPSRKIFPMPPLTMDARTWFNWANKLREYLSQFVRDFDPPELVTGFTIEQRSIGFYLRWNPAKKARSYDIYRSTDGIFENATVVTRKIGNKNVSHLDVVDQIDIINTVLYYWIVPLNEAGDSGPRSLMESTNNAGVPGGGVQGLPFSTGPLGDGRDGAFDSQTVFLTSTTTATESVPIYQMTTMNLEAGKTWLPPVASTINNPSGFIISVQGRCTIAGTIDVSGRGGGGAPATGGAGIGRSGFAGFGWGGTGGGGGGSATAIGGQGGPNRAYTPFGGSDPGGIAPTVGNTQWGKNTTAATEGMLRVESGMYSIGSAGGGTAGNVGVSGGNITAALDVGLFPMLWAFFRSLIFGYGSGGGSGASNTAAGAGGAGGGFVVILCNELDFTGSILANGANGAAGNVAFDGGGGGGGGGGMIIIGYRTLVANTGTVTVTGGIGGAGAGGGAAGGPGGSGYSNIFAMRI